MLGKLTDSRPSCQAAPKPLSLSASGARGGLPAAHRPGPSDYGRALCAEHHPLFLDAAGIQGSVSCSVAARHPGARVIVPPRSGAVPSKTAETAPTQRDQHLQLIADHGRMGWQKASGYNRRALAEAAISRFKRVIGDGLRARTDQRQATEMTVAVAVLNRMLELGRPKSVRIA